MAKKLLEELSWLPLAIKQAASYIKFTNMSIPRYHDLLNGTNKDKETLTSWNFPDETRYPQLPNAIARIWRISFEKINSSDPIAADLLKIMSYIGSEAIPRSLLPPYKSEAQPESAISSHVDMHSSPREKMESFLTFTL
ncbi:Kinesin, putative [Penicillium digitatum PHI26]|uniref:Kinesin, putative n=2 Tax=Penicillium digitatum TaxID=36651 RepID=K9FTP2_PEND2|nr:Kinesin, putative [Penicillium digitatum Pd1]EKV04426.1 Kinesin, putative [Penicillium digitatum PHI26]EKV21758.1 Kinesin, putative [Penicillium digitatum Pd1]